MEKKKSFPWLLVTFLCLYIGLTAFAVTGMVPTEQLLPESTQPTTATEPAPVLPDSDGVFQSLFAQPDWQEIYNRAGEQAGTFEGAEDYAAYMEAAVDHNDLTYIEVQSELPETHRYLVYGGENKIAAFTMSGGPEWVLDTLELFYEPSVSVVVEALPEYSVYVNGVALDDSYTIRTAETSAEAYLPEGVHGYRRKWQQVTGLLTDPEITVLDETGTPVIMERDGETGMYRPVTEPQLQITEAEAELARKAAIADAQYAIGAIYNEQLKAYFDENSAVYKMLITNPRNLQKYTSSSIDESAIQLGQFCRYSDTLFSVNVKLTQKIIRAVGTLKVYQLDKTYFFTLTESGYRVTAYTTDYVTEITEQVQLTYVYDGLQTGVMIDEDASQVSTPEIIIPEGTEFLGWATRTEENDCVTMRVKILPDGTILDTLEPMTLYPVYR